MDAKEPKKPEKISRRRFLSTTGKVAFGFLGAQLAAGTAFIYATTKTPTPLQKGPTDLVLLGEKSDLDKITTIQKFNYNTKIQDGWVEQKTNGFVYVSKDERGELLIFSPICTHLGCTVPFATDAEKNQLPDLALKCPCHGGEYDAMGINIGGPPPRPLDVFKPVVKDGKVYINVFSPIQRKKS